MSGMNALVRPLTAGPKEREEAVAAVVREEQRARRDLALAKLTHTLVSAGLTYRKARAKILDMVEGGDGALGLTAADIPSEEWLRRLARRFGNGATSLSDFMPEGTRGPKRVRFHDEVEKEIDRIAGGDTVRRAIRKAWREMKQNVGKQAKSLGVAIPVPSYPTFRRRVLSRGQQARIASFYGSRQAELTVGPHGVIPARCSHDIHTLDEFEVDRYYRLFDPLAGVWFSWAPSVIIQIDRRSRVPANALIALPTRRLDEKTGGVARSGFDADDVLATIIGAAVADLALPACRPFAGALPLTALRFDRHRTHTTIRIAATAAAKRLTLGLDEFYEGETDQPGVTSTGGADPQPTLLDIPKLPVRMPKSRGDVENLIGFLKAEWADGPGHKARHHPVDRPREDEEERRRSKGAAQGDPILRVDDIDVMKLGTFEDAVNDLNELLDWFANVFESDTDGLTAAQRFKRNLTRQPRPGRDALALLETRMITPQPGSVRVQSRLVRRKFSTFVPDARVQLEPGVPRPVKVDPLLRAVWVRVQKGAEFAMLTPPPSEEHNAEYQSRIIAGREAAHEASEDAAARRRATMDAMLGPGAYEEGRRLARIERARLRAEKGLPPEPPEETASPDDAPAAPGADTRPGADQATHADDRVGAREGQQTAGDDVDEDSMGWFFGADTRANDGPDGAGADETSGAAGAGADE